MNKLKYALLGCFLGAGLSTVAAAQEFNYKGYILSDLRLTVGGQDRPSDVAPVMFDRSDNTVRFTGSFTWGKVDAVADLSVTYSGNSDVSELKTLQSRNAVDPFYFESEALYIRINDFIVDGLDIKLGRQIIDWGSADRFNPTSVINGLDLEDYQDFGRRVANEMVNITYAPSWSIDGEDYTIFGDFQIQFVWVPKFKSGLVPQSSAYAFSEPNEFRRFVKSQTLYNLVDLQELFLDYNGSILYDVQVVEPDFNIKNSQLALRVGFTFMGVDLDFMAYHGYDHNMQPNTVNVNAVSTKENVSKAIDTYIHLVAGNDEERGRLMNIMQAFGEEDQLKYLTGYTDVNVVYPEVWVIGADFATSLDWLGGVGLWGEFSFTFHDDVPIFIDINGNAFNEMQVDKGWFFKAVVGWDNTFTKWFYINMQYIYGFVDEFGDNDLEHYLMVNTDFKMLNEQMLLRLSLVMNLIDPSAIFMPSLTFGFWQGASLVAGGLFHFGEDSSTFGNRTTGPNYIFLQAKYSF